MRSTMPHDPLVSIIIPVYVTSPGQAALLEETLATVQRQRYSALETIVVDDGSTCNVSEIVRRSGGCYVRRRNGGSALARNTGIARARGEYIIFLDGDDHLLDDAVEIGVHQLLAHPDCGFAVGAREEMTFEGEPVPWGVPPPPQLRYLYTSLLAFDWYIIPPSSAIFRRDVVDAVGGFRDPWGADDLDFYLRVAHGYAAVCYADAPVTRYRRYSTSSSRDGERMLHSIRAVYDRQREVVRGDRDAEAAYQRGLNRLTDIFIDCLVENLSDRVRTRRWRSAARAAAVLAWERPSRFVAALNAARIATLRRV